MKTINYDGRLFREIPGYDGYYVSACGILLTTNARWEPKVRPLAQNPDSSGYLSVSCGFRRASVHRSVAMAWIPNPDALPQVNHIDGNKQNNNVTNLEWCTAHQNIRHQLETGLHAHPEQPVFGVNPATGDGVWARSMTAAEVFGFSHKHISACIKGRRRVHKGYEWSKAA